MGKSWDEWRDEQDDVARDAVIVRRHGRDLRTRLRDVMARGDRVWVQCDRVRHSGFVVEVDTDLVSLRDASGERVDVRLDDAPRLLFSVLVPAASAGSTPPLASGGFRGRLLTIETSRVAYVVHLLGDAEPIVGRIEVGLDHVDVVGDDNVVTVPLAMISCVQRRALR